MADVRLIIITSEKKKAASVMHELIGAPSFKYREGATRGDVFLLYDWTLLIHLCGLHSHRLCQKDFGIAADSILASGHIFWRDDRYHYQWTGGSCEHFDESLRRDILRGVQQRIDNYPPDKILRIKKDRQARRFYRHKRRGKAKFVRRYYTNYPMQE